MGWWVGDLGGLVEFSRSADLSDKDLEESVFVRCFTDRGRKLRGVGSC